MTFTTQVPTVPGFYAWIPDENNKHLRQIREVYKHEKLGCCIKNEGIFHDAAIGGLWCLLLPADEIEKAFREGQLTYDNTWLSSRAYKIAKGEEV